MGRRRENRERERERRGGSNQGGRFILTNVSNRTATAAPEICAEGGRERGRDGQPGHQSQLTSGGGREAAAGLKWARERERARHADS